MKKLLTTIIAVSFLLIAMPSYSAPDATVKNDAKVVAKTDAKIEKKAEAKEVKKEDTGEAPPAPGAKDPKTIEEGLEEAGTLIGAVKEKAWWLVAASGIFILMLILQIAGLFKKMGKRVTWIVTGVLSFVAALFLAFNEKGFCWSSFTAYATAGPTIAWLRGFVKKAVFGFGTKEEKKEEEEEKDEG